MEGATPKCFFEDLPKDTLVVGKNPSPSTSPHPPSLHSQLTHPPPPGHYKADHFDPALNAFTSHPDLGIFISVDEVFDNDHRVVAQKGSSSGRFTFSAADSGEHKICFTPLGPQSTGGWLSSGQPVGGIKLTLDMAIGETSAIESTDKGKIMDLVQRVKDLNGRLQDIRREQVFQRVSLRLLVQSELGGGH